MRRKNSFHFLHMGLVAVALLAPSQSEGKLGGSADSIETDRHALSAVRRNSTSHSSYSVHEIESDSANVREYVSSSGVVFGLAWNGLRHPDLNLLLGPYSTEFHEALKHTSRNRGAKSRSVKTSRLVVQMWGHPRKLQGRAYDPTLIPVGVTPDEIK